MGSVFGGLLAEAGVDVALVDTDVQLVEAINERGVVLRQGDAQRTVRVPVTSDPASLRPRDAVIFFVKCQHTRAAADAARPLIGDHTCAVTLQNGWGNADVLADIYGEDRVLAGVTYTSATSVERGIVRTSGPARTIVGALGDDRSMVDPVADALEAAGFPVERPADVLSEVWKKLVLNAATLPTAALTCLTAGDLAATPEMSWLVEAAAAEAVEVGRAQGFSVDLDERLESIRAVLQHAGTGKASMLQDVEAGRRTEIDVISGAVLENARQHGIEVPMTRTLYALIVGLETARGQR